MPARLQIRVWKTASGLWRADPMNLPGTPPNGEGLNQCEAVGSLLLRLQEEQAAWQCWSAWPRIDIYEVDGK